jgi:hypothetical protein
LRKIILAGGNTINPSVPNALRAVEIGLKKWLVG